MKPCNSWRALHSQELLLSLFPPLPTATGAVVAAQLTAVVGRSHGSAALLEHRQGTFGLNETVGLGDGCQCNQDGSRCPAHGTPEAPLSCKAPCCTCLVVSPPWVPPLLILCIATKTLRVVCELSASMRCQTLELALG